MPRTQLITYSIFSIERKEEVGRINGGEACSLYDYEAEQDDELSFHCGEQLRILRRGDIYEREWWWAENRKKQNGYVPYNLLGVSYFQQFLPALIQFDLQNFDQQFYTFEYDMTYPYIHSCLTIKGHNASHAHTFW